MAQRKWTDDPNEDRTMVLVKRMTDGTTIVAPLDWTLREAVDELERLGFSHHNDGTRISAGDPAVRQAFLSWTKDVDAYRRQVGAKQTTSGAK